MYSMKSHKITSRMIERARKTRYDCKKKRTSQKNFFRNFGTTAQMQTYRLGASKTVHGSSRRACLQHLCYTLQSAGVFIRRAGEERRSRDTTARPDRFNAKCRRVLHAAIMVEIYVANISGHPFSPTSPTSLLHARKRSYIPTTRSPGYWSAHGHRSIFHILQRNESVSAITAGASRKARLILELGNASDFDRSNDRSTRKIARVFGFLALTSTFVRVK